MTLSPPEEFFMTLHEVKHALGSLSLFYWSFRRPNSLGGILETPSSDIWASQIPPHWLWGDDIITVDIIYEVERFASCATLIYPLTTVITSHIIIS